MRGVRGRAHELLLSAGQKTLLQAGLRRVSAYLRLFIFVLFPVSYSHRFTPETDIKQSYLSLYKELLRIRKI